jgi:hypothetical protein
MTDDTKRADPPIEETFGPRSGAGGSSGEGGGSSSL